MQLPTEKIPWHVAVEAIAHAIREAFKSAAAGETLIDSRDASGAAEAILHNALEENAGALELAPFDMEPANKGGEGPVHGCACMACTLYEISRA